jgi:GNAT superfamily N-acetyltransferase
MGKPSKAAEAIAGADAAPGFTIRRARPEEARLLSELALRSKAVWGYDASFMARCRPAMRLEPAQLRDNEYHLAEATAAPQAPLGFYGFEPEPDGLGLDMFFVEPAAIGQGVGRALWDHAVGRARALGAEALVAVSDPNAGGFYLKMGCAPAGGRPSEIEPGRILPVFRFALSGPSA